MTDRGACRYEHGIETELRHQHQHHQVRVLLRTMENAVFKMGLWQASHRQPVGLPLHAASYPTHLGDPLLWKCLESWTDF